MSSSHAWVLSMDFGCSQLPTYASKCRGSCMSCHPQHQLALPKRHGDDWRRAVREEARPFYTSWFEYSLSAINVLPENLSS